MKKTTGKVTGNYVVEIPLADGSVSMLVGEIVSRDANTIRMKKAAFVKDTGRRSEFFAGRFDSTCEVEPYPDDVQVELPAGRAMLYTWSHPLLRERR